MSIVPGPISTNLSPDPNPASAGGSGGAATSAASGTKTSDESRSEKLEALGLLTAGFAHQFNNLLGSVMGNAEIASMELDDEHPATSSMAEILKSTKRARALTHAILAFSRDLGEGARECAGEALLNDTATLLRSSLPSWLTVDLVTPPLPALPTLQVETRLVQSALIRLIVQVSETLRGRKATLKISARVAPEAKSGGETAPGSQPLTISLQVVPADLGTPIELIPAPGSEHAAAWSRTVERVERTLRQQGVQLHLSPLEFKVLIPSAAKQN